jgi:glycosyltransferase involved in cell wall biosynthesis
MKKVSIIIPCFNSEKWIKQCVYSVIKQTYKNIEIIIIDNKSRDNSVKVIKQIKETFPMLIFSTIKNARYASWDNICKEGYAMSSGDYITRLASNDFLSPKYIEKCVQNIELGKYECIQSGVINVGQENTVVRGNLYNYRDLNQFKELCLSHCPVNNLTFFFKKELCNNNFINIKSEMCPESSDYDFFCFLANNNTFIFPVQDYLGYNYRWFPTRILRKSNKDNINYKKVIQEYWKQKWEQQ